MQPTPTPTSARSQDDNRLIAVAKQHLMDTRRWSEQEAYAALRRSATDQRVSLIVAAERVLNGGADAQRTLRRPRRDPVGNPVSLKNLTVGVSATGVDVGWVQDALGRDGHSAIALSSDTGNGTRVLDLVVCRRDSLPALADRDVPVLVVGDMAASEAVFAVERPDMIVGYLRQPMTAEELVAAVRVGVARYRRMLVGQAKAVVMQRQQCSDAAAYRWLCRQAERQQRPLVALVREILQGRIIPSHA